ICAVVIHTESAADVHMRDVHAELAQLGVKARHLLEARLDVADVGDLRAEVEVDELHDVEAARCAKTLHGLHELRGVESELGLLTAALLPSPESGGRQLDSDAGRGRDTELLRRGEQHVDLAQLLDDDEYLMSELLAHERQAHELVVLVPVADDEMLRALGETEHGLKLGVRAALEADAVLRAELDDLLDDVALLVDLDRVPDRLATRGLVSRDGIHVPLAQGLDARAEDVGEP